MAVLLGSLAVPAVTFPLGGAGRTVGYVIFRWALSADLVFASLSIRRQWAARRRSPSPALMTHRMRTVLVAIGLTLAGAIVVPVGLAFTATGLFTDGMALALTGLAFLAPGAVGLVSGMSMLSSLAGRTPQSHP